MVLEGRKSKCVPNHERQNRAQIVGGTTVNSETAEVLDCISIDRKKGEDFYRTVIKDGTEVSIDTYIWYRLADAAGNGIIYADENLRKVKVYEVGIDGRRACKTSKPSDVFPEEWKKMSHVDRTIASCGMAISFLMASFTFLSRKVLDRMFQPKRQPRKWTSTS